MVYVNPDDIKIYLMCEHATYGIDMTGVSVPASLVAGSLVARGTTLPGDIWAYDDATNDFASTFQFLDVTGCDITPGLMKETIPYLGINQEADVTIKPENSITITKKKTDQLYSALFATARWGINSSDALTNGAFQPTTSIGYRVFVDLGSTDGSTQDWFIMPGACISEYTITPSTANELEESITFVSKIAQGTSFKFFESNATKPSASGFLVIDADATAPQL